MRNGAEGTVEGALAVLRRAIHNEVVGQRFYSDAAFSCIDPWAKDVFGSLASEEEKHTRLLLLEYEALSERGQWLDPELAMASGAEVDITRFTFPQDDGATDEGDDLFPHGGQADLAIDRRSDDLQALALGIAMEEEALELYGREARTCQDPAAQRAYEFLLEEEARHHQQFVEQWERLAGRPFPGT